MIWSENRFPLFGIKRHCRARPGAKPLEPFGKGSNALKAGTPDAGPESPTVQRTSVCTAVRSAPGRGRAETGPYTRPTQKGKAVPHRISLDRAQGSLLLNRRCVIALTSVSWRYFSRLPCARADL